MHMTKIIETLWRCPYCLTKDIPGGVDCCPHCAHPRPQETKFYLPDEITSYVETPIEKGPDWMCPYCNSYNPHSAILCHWCGAEKENPKDYFQILEERGVMPDLKNPDKENPSSHATHTNNDDYEPSIPTYETRRSYSFDTSSDKHFETHKDTTNAYRRLFSIIGGILLGTMIVCLFIGIFIPKTKTLTIQQTAWTRSIEIEQNTLVEENDWSLPADAVELLYTRQEIHHYDHVLDHYETVTEQKSRQVEDGYDITYTYRDLGNGYAEREEHRTPKYRTEYYTETHEQPVYRDEPVYRTKYYYTIWRYKYHHSVTESDYSDITHRVEPYWPEYNLSYGQRVGTRIEKYAITCTEGKKQKNYTCDYELWVQFIPGNTYKVKTAFGRITKIVQ
jgi:hypothetical protein